MTTLKALGIVLDLAEQNVADWREVGPDMQAEIDRQEEAIEEVRAVWKEYLARELTKSDVSAF